MAITGNMGELGISAVISIRDMAKETKENLQKHIDDKNNPHGVTKEDVGLGNADNTSDKDKPVSNAVQEALDKKADTEALQQLSGELEKERQARSSADSQASSALETERMEREAADRELVAAIDGLSIPGGGSCATCDIVIPAEGWQERSGDAQSKDYPYSIEFSCEESAERRTPVISIVPDDLDIAQEAGLCAGCRSGDGTLRLWAKQPPAQPIHASVSFLMSGFTYANALVGSAESEHITLTDAVPGTPLTLSIYGACTEVGKEEKSLENPSTVTCVGESGSLTLTVGEKEIEIPLSGPLYGIRHPDTGAWLARDEIRVENGRVVIRSRIAKTIFNETSSIEVVRSEKLYGDYGYSAVTRATPIGVGGLKWDSPQRYAVLCPQIKTGINPLNSMQKDIALGYNGGYSSFTLVHFELTEPLPEVTADALRAWAKAYNESHEIPITFYYEHDGSETDITDTEAGRALLALSASENMEIYTNEGSPVGVRYHRDVNKALAELQNAIIALGGLS